MVVPPAGVTSGVGGPRLVRWRHGDSTVSEYDSGDGFTALLVRVTRDGSTVVHELTIGLGPDGRVAGRILASLRATT